MMKQSFNKSKQCSQLPDFEHRLNMYALAASAAGVGMLAVAQPAEGKIIYTKANKQIGPKTTFHLDLNHDGVADFDLKDALATSSYGGIFGTLSALPDEKHNAVWGHTAFRKGYASALYAGVPVGPKGQFLRGAGFMAASSHSGLRAGPWMCTGPWADVTNRYLGLKFTIKGETHFGWARLNVSCSNATVNATLTGYAYETIRNRPIVTGKKKGDEESDSRNPVGASPVAVRPAGLGQLAQGTAGVTRW